MEENKINDIEEQTTEGYDSSTSVDTQQSVVDSDNAPIYSTHSFIDTEQQERLHRKREIRRLSNATAIPLIGFDVVGFIVVLILEVLLLIFLGYDRTAALMTDSNFNYLFNGFFSLLYLSLPFVLINRMTKTKLSETVAFGRCRFGKAVSVTMLGFGVIAVTQYASSYLNSFLTEILGQPIQTPMPEYGTGTVSLIINLVCVGLIPAVMEEFAFRGVILGTTRKFTSDGLAILINAVLFSMLHGNLHQIPFTFAIGLFLAYITVYTGSVVPAMIVHGVNNTLSVLISMYTNTVNVPVLIQVLIMVVYYGALLLIGIVGLILFIHVNKDPLKLSKERSENTKEAAVHYFTSAGFIIFAIMTAISVLDVQFGITETIIKKLFQ